MIGYIIVGAICLFVGIYLGNKEFREKTNTQLKSLANKMQQKTEKTEDATLKDRTQKTYVIKATPKAVKPTKQELPVDLSTLSKDELIEVLKNSDVKVVSKGGN